MKKILITSVGSLVGTNILKSLGPRQNEWYIIGVNSQPLAVNNFRCDVAYLAPETSQESAYLSRMRSILRLEEPAVVLAGRDFDLFPLARLKEEPEFDKILFLLPSKACVPVVNDKYETWLFAQRHGLPFAHTAFDRDELDKLIAKVGFPLICKRRLGNASQGVFIVREAKEAEAALAKGGFVFQEFLNPPQNLQDLFPDFHLGVPLFYGINEYDHYSAQGLVGYEGELLAFIATLHILEGGKDISVHPIDEPALERITADYARVLGPLGYIGPLNFNLKKIGSDQFVPYEINGRFGGGSAARAALGHPEVEYALDYFLDEIRPEFSYKKSRSNFMRQIVHLRPETQLFDLDMVSQLKSDGIWRRKI